MGDTAAARSREEPKREARTECTEQRARLSERTAATQEDVTIPIPSPSVRPAKPSHQPPPCRNSTRLFALREPTRTRPRNPTPEPNPGWVSVARSAMRTAIVGRARASSMRRDWDRPRNVVIRRKQRAGTRRLTAHCGERRVQEGTPPMRMEVAITRAAVPERRERRSTARAAGRGRGSAHRRGVLPGGDCRASRNRGGAMRRHEFGAEGDQISRVAP